MKLKPLFILAALVLTAACSQNNNYEGNVNLTNQIDSVSYALGYQYGEFMAQQNVGELDVHALASGLHAGLNKNTPQIDDIEAQRILTLHQRERTLQLAEQNLKEGREFLAKNIENEGVQQTESGLQYKVIEAGTGRSPSAENVVKVHYEGRLLNGEIFDSSYLRGEPIEFALNRVIPGWTEGVQLMKEGATYELYIPANLAYGERGPQGSPIGPNSTLIFKVELLEVID